MNDMDELLVHLQTGIKDLYLYVRRAEEFCSDDNANFHERFMMNNAWLKLENAILNLENLAHKMIRQRAGTGD